MRNGCCQAKLGDGTKPKRDITAPRLGAPTTIFLSPIFLSKFPLPF